MIICLFSLTDIYICKTMDPVTQATEHEEK